MSWRGSPQTKPKGGSARPQPPGAQAAQNLNVCSTEGVAASAERSPSASVTASSFVLRHSFVIEYFVIRHCFAGYFVIRHFPVHAPCTSISGLSRVPRHGWCTMREGMRSVERFGSSLLKDIALRAVLSSTAEPPRYGMVRQQAHFECATALAAYSRPWKAPLAKRGPGIGSWCTHRHFVAHH